MRRVSSMGSFLSVWRSRILSLLIVEEEVEQGQKRDDDAYSDADMHGPRMWEPQEPGRNDEPKSHQNVEPFFPVPIGDNGCQRDQADDDARDPEVDLARLVRESKEPWRYEQHGREEKVVEIGYGFALLPFAHDTPPPCEGTFNKSF